jgi:hypothetical protein
MGSRWDGDENGQGVNDAAQLVARAGELVAAFGHPTWDTEQPELHLLPHVEAWCRRHGQLAVTRAYTDDAHACVLDMEWGGATGSIGAARTAAFALIGSFAESATYVRQRWVPRNDGATAMILRQRSAGDWPVKPCGRNDQPVNRTWRDRRPMHRYAVGPPARGAG